MPRPRTPESTTRYTCWISARSPTIRTTQSSASTSYPTRWWPRNVHPCPKSLDAPSATTTSTSARVCSTSLCVLRAQERMAASGHYRATYGGGFRLGYAAAGGRALSHNREGAGGPRQPKHSQPGLVVQGVRAGGSQAPLASAGVPPHPHARLLAEHGGDRALGALGSVWSVASPIPRGSQGRLGHGSTSATKEGRRCNGASPRGWSE